MGPSDWSSIRSEESVCLTQTVSYQLEKQEELKVCLKNNGSGGRGKDWNNSSELFLNKYL